MFLLAAISLGFLGSFHCVGMCGPIALTIPVNRKSFFSVISGSAVYNLGRITTYALMGLLFGLIGQGVALAGWQSLLSIVLGSLILILLFLPKISLIPMKLGTVMHFLESLKSKIRTLFGIHTFRSLFFIGFLNGLLPCGLVYLGIAGSVATGDALKGALFMAAFGLGTFPAMMTVTMIRDRINISFREKIRKTIPVFVGMMAILLILRGMNLGIPYVSPSIGKTTEGSCHHQCCHK
jgi:sulfite exporter TauE/SafE